MNFENFVKAWQCQKPGVIKSTINDPEALLREIRLEHRVFKWMYFLHDIFIVGVEAVLIPWFLYSAIRFHDWGFYVMAFACFFIGVFILVDRWFQRRQQPITNGTLAACIKSSLVQVKHEVWRSKNVFWWYVLPLEIGFGAVTASSAWQAYHQWLADAHVSAVSSAVFALVFGLSCALIGWFTYWLSQRGVKKQLEPRQKELEELLAGLEQ